MREIAHLAPRNPRNPQHRLIHPNTFPHHSPPLSSPTSPPSLQDRFLSLVSLPTSFKPLPPSTAAAFCSTATRLAETFLSNPSDETLLVFLALPKVDSSQACFETRDEGETGEIPQDRFATLELERMKEMRQERGGSVVLFPRIHRESSFSPNNASPIGYWTLHRAPV